MHRWKNAKQGSRQCPSCQVCVAIRSTFRQFMLFLQTIPQKAASMTTFPNNPTISINAHKNLLIFLKFKPAEWKKKRPLGMRMLACKRGRRSEDQWGNTVLAIAQSNRQFLFFIHCKFWSDCKFDCTKCVGLFFWNKSTGLGLRNCPPPSLVVLEAKVRTGQRDALLQTNGREKQDSANAWTNTLHNRLTKFKG